MTTASSTIPPDGDDPTSDAAPRLGQHEPIETAATKLRVWPLFAVSLVELMFAAMLQGVAAVALLFTTRADGQSMEEAIQSLPGRMMEPPVFILMFVLSGFSITAGAFLFGWISARHRGISIQERLGLKWPAISTASLASFLLGSIPVLLISVGVVLLIETVLPGDESVLELYRNLSNGWAVVFIVVIGVVPGFGEELFFRGFFQRRMLQRFRPAVAIGVTSLVFGLFHVTPHAIALATILGVWLGVIAWRTDSIWPGVCCHAFINSGWNVYQVGRFQWGFPTIPPIWLCVVGGLLVLAAFAWSVRILRSPTPQLAA